MRTPRRGRSKSIVVPVNSEKSKGCQINRLNNYNKTLKKHKGPLSLQSDLQSIKEDEESSKHESQNKRAGSSAVIYDADENQE